MLVVTCDVTGAAGPLCILLALGVVPGCDVACACDASLRILLCPRRYVGCYLRCHRRGWTLRRFVLTCVVTCVCCVRVTAVGSGGCYRSRCCLPRAASYACCTRAAMLVVTCDFTGAAGPLSLLLLPVLLPACAVCVLPPLCRLLWELFPAAVLPAPERIACVLYPRRYVGCYLRCHRRCWTLLPFVVTCVVTCVVTARACCCYLRWIPGAVTCVPSVLPLRHAVSHLPSNLSSRTFVREVFRVFSF